MGRPILIGACLSDKFSCPLFQISCAFPFLNPRMVSDKEFIRLYLFKNNPEGCCKFWFGESSVDSCVKSIIQSTYIDTNGAQASGVAPVDKTKLWYPNMHRHKCENDASMPLWMLEEDYAEWYLHHSSQQCNAAFGFS